VGTVKARLSRGRTMLAALLNERADEAATPAASGAPPASPLPPPAARRREPPRSAARPYAEQPHYAPEQPHRAETPRDPDLLSWPGHHG
jgi:hypothetical protein